MIYGHHQGKGLPAPPAEMWIMSKKTTIYSTYHDFVKTGHVGNDVSMR